MSSHSRQLARSLSVAGGFFLLNALFTVHRWLPAGKPFFAILPALEPVVLLASLTWIHGRASDATYRRTAFLAGIPVALLIAYGLGEAFFRYVYQAPFSPRTDLVFLPAFLNMVIGRDLLEGYMVIIAAVALAGLACAWLLGRLMGWIARSLRVLPATASIAVAVAALTVGGLVGGAPLTLGLASSLAAPNIGTATLDAESAPGGSSAPEVPPVPAVATPESPAAGSPTSRAPCPALAGRDIRLFIVESYGHTLFTQEDHRVLIDPVYDELDQRLGQAGFSVVSSFLSSPAFGGRSWLADASLLSGLWIGDQDAYNSMHLSGVETLVALLRDAGYHTLLAAPGMTYIEEEWFSFFPYETVLIQDDFDYRGRTFSFGGGITDQFLINSVRLRLADQPDTRPLFATYILVSSHVPFNVLPPFLPEWESIGDGAVYNEYPRIVFDNNWLTGGEYPLGYTESIEYVLVTIVDYLESFVADNTVAIVVGDHQPRIPIAERESTYSVPIHVISRDGAFLATFRRYGFVDGLRGNHPLPHRKMSEFHHIFVSAARSSGS